MLNSIHSSRVAFSSLQTQHGYSKVSNCPHTLFAKGSNLDVGRSLTHGLKICSHICAGGGCCDCKPELIQFADGDLRIEIALEAISCSRSAMSKLQ